MSQLFTMGRVISDPELKTSPKKTPYTNFLFVERVGIGEYAHDQNIMVYAKEPLASQLIKAGVKTKSLVWLTGVLELAEFTKKSDGTNEKGLRLMLRDWGYLPFRKWQTNEPQSATNKLETEEADGNHAAVINGDLDNLPG